MAIDLAVVFQGVGVLALLLTASGTLATTLVGLRNYRVSKENQAIATDLRTSVGQISVDVDGRFTASQEQISRLIGHMLTLDPAIAAKAASELIVTAEKKAAAILSAAADHPLAVRVVTDEAPIPVIVIGAAPTALSPPAS